MLVSNLLGMIVGASFVIVGFRYFRRLPALREKALSVFLIGLGGYIVWTYWVQENYMVNF